jgi:glycosyltransferase involved in cell wall biosynthesis
MRVLHVMASRANGGAETYSIDMIESLHAAGIDQVAAVRLASLHHQRLTAAGVTLAPKVLVLPITMLRKRELQKLVREMQPDLVHCWMRRAASLMPPVDAPVIGWFGGYYEPAHFYTCSHFVGVTPDIVRHMVSRGVPADRAFYVPTFPTIEPGATIDRATLDTPADATVLLALSRLHEKKGLDILLRALVDLPQCVAWLAGDGPLEAELTALAADLGVASRVRFLGWRTDRGALLKAADICVLPSRYEPFGTVMLEAWAADTPLVAAASQGPAALVRDGENGLLVPIDDVTSLTAAIQRLMSEPELTARLIARGRQDYQDGFTREAVTARMIDLYRNLIAGHDRAASKARSAQA